MREDVMEQALEDADIEEMLMEADRNVDGNIPFDDFIRMMMQN